jgi:hypothetical protein
VDDSKYQFAVGFVAERTHELMIEGHSQEEALGVLLTMIQTGVLQAESEDLREYEMEIEAVLKRLLKESN